MTCFRSFFALLLFCCWMPAWATPPVSYRTLDGASLKQIAVRDGVSLKSLRKANPGKTETSEWLVLPEGAKPSGAVDVALMASAYQEISAIVQAAQIEGVYRIVGREFYIGTWQGSRIVAGFTGGNMNNAAIGTTILLQHFDVRAMGFVGIAGGGPTTRVGDVLIATGAAQHDQGNWYDFELPSGEVFAGLTWQMRGQPVLTDAGRRAQLGLFPEPQLLERIRRSVAEVELPLIGADVAEFHGVERYRPSVLVDSWSMSGAQFITSHHARATFERRMAIAARRLEVPVPQHLFVDQEDFAAVHAAAEHEVPWFILRVVVDLAAQKQADRGVPLELYDDPERIGPWLSEHGQQSHAKNFDYSYFYRQVEIAVRPIVRELSGAAR
jgi:nucleoside phosphorylase